MNKEEIAFKKMALLMEAIEETRHRDEAMKELMSSAFEVLLLHPGCDIKRWRTILLEQYGTEVMDALEPVENGTQLIDKLNNLWETPYEDIASGLEYTFKNWAEVFSTDASVRMYYDMLKKLKNIDAM